MPVTEQPHPTLCSKVPKLPAVTSSHWRVTSCVAGTSLRLRGFVADQHWLMMPCEGVLVHDACIRLLNAFDLSQEGTKKECGLHSGNIADVSNGAEDAERDLWPKGPVEALSKDQLQQLADGPRDKATIVVLYAPWCQFSKVTLLLKHLSLAHPEGAEAML